MPHRTCVTHEPWLAEQGGSSTALTNTMQGIPLGSTLRLPFLCKHYLSFCVLLCLFVSPEAVSTTNLAQIVKYYSIKIIWKSSRENQTGRQSQRRKCRLNILNLAWNALQLESELDLRHSTTWYCTPILCTGRALLPMGGPIPDARLSSQAEIRDWQILTETASGCSLRNLSGQHETLVLHLLSNG